MIVIGKNGQVAKALQKIYPDAVFLSRNELDMSSVDSVYSVISQYDKPNILINASAYTAVDLAEDNHSECDAINHLAVAELARYCADNNIIFVHYSTDYVFDGEGDIPFIESSKNSLSPCNIYGKTKLLGEEAIQNSGCDYYIFRTSWVYDKEGSNFVNSMLKLATSRDKLSIVADQIGSPTSAYQIADMTRQAIDLQVDFGTYHMVSSNYVSWADFARKIFEVKKLNVIVEDIPSSTYKTKAKRPLNSRLSNTKLSDAGVSIKTWEQALKEVLND